MDRTGDTLPKLFLRNAERLSGEVALREKELGVWRRVTWRDYRDEVARFALGLIELGLRPGDKVSILGDNCKEWLYADLAIQCAAAVTVGVYPTAVATQVEYVLANSESRFVVARDQEQVDKILEIKGRLPLLQKIIVIDTKGLRRYRHPEITSFAAVQELGAARDTREPGLFEEAVRRTRTEDPAIIVYTSGTTGPPKGAVISHRNMIAMVRGLFERLQLGPRDSFVSALPLCHVAERMFSLIFPMWSGSTVNFAESVQTLQEDLREISPTAFFNVPRIFEKIHSDVLIKMQDAVFFKRWVFRALMPVGERVARMRLGGRRVPLAWRALYGLAYLALFRALRNRLGLLETRVCVTGAAPISPELLAFYAAIGLPVVESYGLTEMTGICTFPADGEHRFGSVGKPLPGVELRFADDGEILLRGDSVFEGYYRDPVATDAVIVDGWLHTGDVGQVDPNGSLRITDRKKDIIINAAGKNIAPSEIENALKFSPYIKEAVVIGDRRKYLTCLVQIEFDNVANWAQASAMPYTNYKSLATHPRVHELVEREIDKVNRSFSRVETIKKFRILEKELDEDDAELTATMKVRRSVIANKYETLIESMYR